MRDFITETAFGVHLYYFQNPFVCKEVFSKNFVAYFVKLAVPVIHQAFVDLFTA